MRKCRSGPEGLPPDLTSLRFPPDRRGERNRMTLETTGNRPRVLVVGAGFAGLYAVRGLKKSGYQVTLIEKNLYSTFQPLLYQVATGGLNPGDVSYVVGGFTARRRTRYVRGELAGVELPGGGGVPPPPPAPATSAASWPASTWPGGR